MNNNTKRRVDSLRNIRAFLRAALAETPNCDDATIGADIVRALDHTLDVLLVLEHTGSDNAPGSAEDLESLVTRSLMLADRLKDMRAAAALNTALVCISGRGMPPRAM